MSNVWDNLTNAKHIDKVLAHSALNPKKWVARFGPAREACLPRRAVWDTSRVAARNAAWNAAWMNAGAGRVRVAVWDAIQTLIAYDDCGYLLDFTPQQIHLYACLGVPAAVLLEPAVKAMYYD